MDFDMMNEELPSEDLEHGPTFEDLAIDDTLSDLDRVCKYICSNIALQRVIHVKMLPDTARTVGFEDTCEYLIPLLEPLANDDEYVVRQHAALQFPALCSFLVTTGGEPGYRLMLEKLVPLISKLVSDKQHEVRTAASDSLVDMAALVKAEDQGQYILTIVLPLAHDDDNEQFRISAVTLYNGLAEHLGADLCQQFCVPELISLSEDPVFRVRKSTVQSFSNVCKTAGPELSRERLLPAFQRLACDDIWAVRKACAECLVSISEALAPSDRGALLIPIFDAFLDDSSRWVRMAAYQSLGPFLASLEREDISDELLQHFVGMASSATAAQLGGSGEADMKFHCAYNFPAVVSILGPEQWPRLASTFEALSQDSFWKIRRTFAYSLHELARLLGADITEAHLATAFDTYLRDVPEVKLGAMMHFADFLHCVSPSFRESYLPVLSELLSGLTSQSTKWRVREIVSSQLPQLCHIFPTEATYAVIYPLVLQLLSDEVAIVRQHSVPACPLLMARVAHRDEWREHIVARLTALAASPRFPDRQLFARICESFLSAKVLNNDPRTSEGQSSDAPAPPFDPQEFFRSYLAESFFSLAVDVVANVRIVFASVVLAFQDEITAVETCPAPLRQVLEESASASPDELVQKLKTHLPPKERPPRPERHHEPREVDDVPMISEAEDVDTDASATTNGGTVTTLDGAETTADSTSSEQVVTEQTEETTVESTTIVSSKDDSDVAMTETSIDPVQEVETTKSEEDAESSTGSGATYTDISAVQLQVEATAGSS